MSSKPAAPRPMNVEDLWALRRIGTPAVDRKGRFAVAAVTTWDMEANESSARLMQITPGDPDLRPLTAEGAGASSPALSPDGRRVAFLRPDAEKRPQLAILPLDGGEAEIVTDMPLGVADPKWFPDGRKIAFLAGVYRDALDLESARRKVEEHKRTKVKAHVTEDRLYRYWDDWLTEGRVYHIFVLDLETRALTDLIPDSRRWFDLDGPDGCYDISPDGAEIAFSADRSEPPHDVLNWDVFTVNVSGGHLRNVTAHNTGHDLRPRYSPCGRYLLYGMQRRLDYYADRVRLVLVDRPSGAHHVLTEAWDRSAAVWEFAADGASILLLAEDRARVSLFRAGLKPGEPQLVRAGGTFQGLAPLADGRVVTVRQTISLPPDVIAIAADGSAEEPWTALNADRMAGLALGEVREGSVAGSEGREIQFFEVLPPGFTPDRRYPLLLIIHGGPHGIWADQFHYRWNLQLFAAPGYVVVAPNPHGSTSFGDAFADCIQGDWGGKPYRDLMAITDAMAARDYVDSERLAAAGGSYGGYMAAWIAGQTDRFACLVNHAGVSDLLAEYASDVTHDWGRALGGEPWDGIDAIDAMNPVRHAAGFRSPMLVIHGEKDYRVVATQALEIYNIYRARGLPARLVVFPDENHWVLKPLNARLWYGEVFAWFRRWFGYTES